MAVALFVCMVLLGVPWLGSCSPSQRRDIGGPRRLSTAVDGHVISDDIRRAILNELANRDEREEASGSGPADENVDDEPETDQQTCGVPAVQPNVDLARVVGGQEATKHSWPWMVSLQVSGHHFCGGSLINNQWVMSAAHCSGPFRHADPENRPVVVLGAHNKSESDSGVVRVPAKAFAHEKFNMRRDLSNDFMMLKLDRPVEFTDFISPVCLPPPFKELAPGTSCYLTGWGRMWLAGDIPDVLQQVKLEIIDRDVCNKPEWYDGSVDDTMVCAGYAQGGVGGCHGDSGGPLVCLADGQWVQYGVVSWGYKCSNPRKPANFARVSAYRRWMDTKMRENTE